MAQYFTRKIKPANEDMLNRFNAWETINQFMVLGFVTCTSFVELVATTLSDFDTTEGRQLLCDFWEGKNGDALINEQLILVLNAISRGLPMVENVINNSLNS